jgi:glycosyltransferase involved in cell wall biosynthesis
VTFGIVPFEAMSCGRKVIAPEGFGAAELIEDGVNGFLVKNDFSDFPEKFKQLLDSDLKKKTIRKTVIDNMSLNVFGRKMERLLIGEEE